MLGNRTLLLLICLSPLTFHACGSEAVPSAPCSLDCGAPGVCALALGQEVCVCEEARSGPACELCSEGFVEAGGQCVADPCNPDPCQTPYQDTCQVSVDGFECLCSDDAQDNDGDGVCRPSCAAVLADNPGQSCDDSSGEALLTGERGCQTVVTFAPETPYDAVSLPGEFNGWDQSAAMTRQEDGTFSLSLDLSAGDHAYKFYIPSQDLWLEDPNNPLSKYVGGVRNSRLKVPDCSKPLLRLLQTPETTNGDVSFRVQVVPGAGADLGQAVAVTREGQPIDAAFDPTTGLVTVTDTALPTGKYAYLLKHTGASGVSAEPLFVPVWVEDSPFDWRDAVMYFVMTDRFADGDPTNNAPVEGVDPRANWQGGDFAGLRARLESGYFERLGVNALWISSISMNTQGAGAGSDGRLYSAYHSYWPVSTGWSESTQLQGVAPVDPHFGTLEDFRSLVALAHSKGIRVLVDFVANHVHEDSPLWAEHQGDTSPWFHLPREVCQDIDWSKPIECWFAGYLPDFEFTNLDVMKSVVEHALWIVRETNIDGFRLDAVKHMVDDLTLTLRAEVDGMLARSADRFYMVGETFTGEDGAEEIKRFVGPDKLDGQFDFPLFWQVTSTFLRGERDLRSLEGMLAWSEGFYGEGAVMSNFLGNHDVCRAVSHANGDFGDMWCNGGKAQGWDAPPETPSDPDVYARLNLAWAFLMTAPGVPLIYYGDEVGMPGAGDPDNRRMMVFGDALTPAQRGVIEHVSQLTRIRRDLPALRRGTRTTLEMSDDGQLWTFVMDDGGQKVAVTMNNTAEPRGVDLDAEGLGLDDGVIPVDVLSGIAATRQGEVVSFEMPGRAAAVWVIAD